MEKTVFSKIVDREIPAHILYEDEHTIAFLDIHPVSEGHTLVICKQPYEHIDDCPTEVYDAIFKTVHKLTKTLRQRLDPVRVGLLVHGFDVPHAHVHLIPMYTGTEVSVSHNSTEDFAANLEATAAKLKD